MSVWTIVRVSHQKRGWECVRKRVAAEVGVRAGQSWVAKTDLNQNKVIKPRNWPATEIVTKTIQGYLAHNS